MPLPGGGGSFFNQIASQGIGFAQGGIMAGIAFGRNLLDGLFSVFGALGNIGSKIGGILSDVFTKAVGLAATAALTIVATTVASLARSQGILALSQSTGMSLGAASRAVTGAQAFGVSAPDLSGSSLMAQRMAGGFWNVKGEFGSPERTSSFRDRYRELSGQGEFGFQMAQSMARALKMEGFIPAANLSDAQFKRQQSMAAGLEMNPNTVSRVGQEFKGILDILGLLGTKITNTLTEAFLPAMTAGVEGLISFWQKNQKKIIDIFWRIGDWLYSEFPPMVLRGLSFVAHGVTKIFNGIGEFVTNTLPKILDFIQQSVTTVWGWLQKVGGYVGLNLPNLPGAGGSSGGSVPDSPAGNKAGNAAGAAMGNAFGTGGAPHSNSSFKRREYTGFHITAPMFWTTVGASALASLPEAAVAFGVGGPAAGAAMLAKGTLTRSFLGLTAIGVGGTVAKVAMDDTYNRTKGAWFAKPGDPTYNSGRHGVVPQGTTSGSAPDPNAWTTRLGAPFLNGAKWVDTNTKWIDDALKDPSMDPKTRHKEYEALRRIAEATEKTAEATKKTAGNTQEMGERLVGRVLAYMGEDAVADLLRI